MGKWNLYHYECGPRTYKDGVGPFIKDMYFSEVSYNLQFGIIEWKRKWFICVTITFGSVPDWNINTEDVSSNPVEQEQNICQMKILILLGLLFRSIMKSTWRNLIKCFKKSASEVVELSDLRDNDGC